MATTIEALVEQAARLPKEERLTLIAQISETLTRGESDSVERGEAAPRFNAPVSDWRELIARDIWPEEDELDEFDAFSREARELEIKRQLQRDSDL